VKLTPEKLTAFCAALAETCNVGRACAAVGISRWTAYHWRREMPDFAKAWDEAMRVGVSALEDEAHRRGFEGVDKPLVHQGQFTYLRDFNAINPETGECFTPECAPVLKDANGAPRIATMKEYSDTLAIFLLKAHDPEKYRERSDVSVKGEVSIAQAIVAARQRSSGDCPLA
jgi:hypothetical protein